MDEEKDENVERKLSEDVIRRIYEGREDIEDGQPEDIFFGRRFGNRSRKKLQLAISNRSDAFS